ncbi:Bdr family repetitive protein, partial [Borreliella garinii]
MENMITNIAQDRIYKELLKLGMEQSIALDLSRIYCENKLIFEDLDKLKKQFNLRFDNLIYKIDCLEDKLNDKIDSMNTVIVSVKNEFTF